MKRGRCSKCGSTNVRRQPKMGRDSFMVGLRTVYLDRFVCVGCGYTEKFVADPKMLGQIERKWPLAIS